MPNPQTIKATCPPKHGPVMLPLFGRTGGRKPSATVAAVAVGLNDEWCIPSDQELFGTRPSEVTESYVLETVNEVSNESSSTNTSSFQSLNEEEGMFTISLMIPLPL